MSPYYRDERAARRLPALVPVAAQDAEEGYRLVGPDGRLTPVIEHVQWLDNHPAGPDTHVTISFEGGAQVEFPFGVPLTMCWHDERRPVTDSDLLAAVPSRWGVRPNG